MARFRESLTAFFGETLLDCVHTCKIILPAPSGMSRKSFIFNGVRSHWAGASSLCLIDITPTARMALAAGLDETIALSRI